MDTFWFPPNVTYVQKEMFFFHKMLLRASWCFLGVLIRFSFLFSPNEPPVKLFSAEKDAS